MPRTTRSKANGGAENSDPLRNLVNRKIQAKHYSNKALSLIEENNVVSKKSNLNKKRAALGEITNAFSETKSQAKKGLNKIISKSKSTLTRTASIRKSKSSSDEKLSLKLKQDEDDSEVQVETFSLPSSQDFEFSQSQSPIIFEVEVNKSDDELFESAEEELSTENQTTDSEIKTSGKVIPPNVIDFDANNADDPFQVSEYVKETFQYYKDREATFRCPDYLNTVQHDITTSMRAILVDWMVEVQESFELNHESLYTAVKIVDLFLSQVKTRKENLQLVGATACLIACKLDERLPPLLDDFVYVCDDAYTREDIIAMEMKIIKTLNYDLGYPISYRFLRRYGRVCQVSMPVLTFARYVLEMSLMEYSVNVDTSESKLAFATMALTLIIKNQTGYWRETLEFYSGYKMEECTYLIEKLHKILLKPPHPSRKTIKTKYEHDVFHRVARTQIPLEIEL